MIKPIALNITCAAFAVMANALLKHSLEGRISWKGNLTGLIWDALTMFKYPLVWAGAAAFVAANLIWLLILATQKMSVAYPLQLSLVILFSFIASVFVFAETVSLRGCVGLGFLVLGIVFVAG